MQDIHKVCPDCGDEFQALVEVCPDCGVSLHWSPGDTSVAGGSFGSGAPRLDPSPDLVLVRSGELSWVRSLAARLDGKGIRSFTSIVPDPSLAPEHLGTRNFHHDGTYHLFVGPEDLEAGREVDHAFLLEQLGDPDGLGGFSTQESGACPACGSFLPEDAEECPSCELRFRWPGDPEESEARQG